MILPWIVLLLALAQIALARSTHLAGAAIVFGQIAECGPPRAELMFETQRGFFGDVFIERAWPMPGFEHALYGLKR